MTPQEKNTKIVIIILITVGVLLVLSGPLSVLSYAGLYEEFNFRIPTEPIPENAVIIKLTEEDYEE